MTARTKKFAIDVLRFAKQSIPKDPLHSDIASQLTRSAAYVGAGYRAACRARSRADFVYTLVKTIEEIDEAAFWLEILRESGLTSGEATKALWQEAEELTRILVRSRETAQRQR